MENIVNKFVEPIVSPPVYPPIQPPPSYFQADQHSSTAVSRDTPSLSSISEAETVFPLSSEPVEHANSPLSSAFSHLYCVGGKNSTFSFRISEFFPTTKTWRPIFEENYERYSFGIATYESKIFLARASCFQMFDCSEPDSLTNLPTLSTERHDCALAALGDSLFLSGGEYEIKKKEDDKVKTKYRTSNDVFQFDIEQNQWKYGITGMKNTRKGHSMIAHNGLLYAIGGNAYGNSIEEYHPSLNKWIETGIDFKQQEFTSATVHNGVLYVCGEDYFQMAVPGVKSSERILLSTPSMRGCSIVSFNGRLIATGGCLRNTIEKTALVFEYDPRNQYWIRLPDMEVPRKRHKCVTVNY